MDWGWLYAHLKISLGYTHEQVDEMTLPMIIELNKYWKDNPPQHILVKSIATYLGAFKPETKSEEFGDIGEFMAATSQINGHS
jgi:hypothetical protein